jgi:hypothetical protein
VQKLPPSRALGEAEDLASGDKFEGLVVSIINMKAVIFAALVASGSSFAPVGKLHYRSSAR